MHPRRVIRDFVADAIRAANTAAGDRVWAAFDPPVNVEKILIDEGPCVFVYTRRERSHENDYATQGHGYVKRTCELCVEIIAAGAQAVDNKLDDLAEAIELLVDGIEVEGMPSAEIRLMETAIEASDQFEQPVGGAFLLYDACYYKPWRGDDDDGDEFFPSHVDVVTNGSAEGRVADCEDCPDACGESDA